MDHKVLTFLQGCKNANARLTRWTILLAEYNLKIEFVKGKENVVADFLSRIHFWEKDAVHDTGKGKRKIAVCQNKEEKKASFIDPRKL